MSGSNGWESVYTSENDRLERRRAEHGWLYRNLVRWGSAHGGFEWAMALTYEPDEVAPLGFDAGTPAP